ncbi:hypothetical protein FOMPIDRAFT_1028701 [Fomitopsis schrenkii]|uniref:Deacetylase sirtuin-type domain-containing protein n=1 Tax=Fomitopsis schrenkii TaxID=2126942 RepID=S8FYY2_FOMSC|nr:hypothetical protein FOMPIDRAFT_1028701 [Fomitopsis schrenkii]
MLPSSDYKAFRDTLASSQRVVILTGAGLSVASGIPTFREPNGLWKYAPLKSSLQFDPQDEFKQDPSRIWQFYHCIRQSSNAAHNVIASLALPADRSQLMAASASGKPPLLITQNFDGLSFRALNALASQFDPAELKIARECIIEMHGSINKTHSLDAEFSPALSRITETDMGELVIPVGQLSRCGGPHWNGSNRFGRCGGLHRPAVVWFSEVPEGMGEIAKGLNWTDLLIIVHPAAWFATSVKHRGGKIAVFNLEPSLADEHADFLFIGPCEVTLPSILGVEISK